MKRLAAAAVLVGAGSLGAQDVALVGVTVVDPSARVAAVAGQTVLVSKGIIREVGPAASVVVPSGVRRVDGSGKFVIPGLWDAHVHFMNATASALPLYVALGVTSVREMGAFIDSTRAWQKAMRAGTLVGPRIVTSGHIPESPRFLQGMQQRSEGSLMAAVDSGRSELEHAFFPPLATLPAEARDSVYLEMAKHGTWYTPTLVVSNVVTLSADSAMRAIFSADTGSARQAAMQSAFESSVADVRRMHELGVLILAGTDAGSVLVYPGFSLHEELALLVERAGLAPIDALWSATVGPARFAGLGSQLGAITPGRIADLVLLDANPLDNIRNTRRISAVVQAGRVFLRRELDMLMVQNQKK